MSPLTSIVVFSLVAAVALVAGGWLTSGGILAALKHDIGNATWDFSKSWASNATVAGAIVGSVFSAKILPDHPTVVATPNGYTALSLVFGAAVVVAPLLFTALRRGKSDPAGPQYTGRGWAFLLASCVTLWGVIGQLATIGLMLYEAQHGKTVALGAVIPIWALMGLALVLVAVYGFTSVRLTVEPDSNTFTIESVGGTKTMASHGWTLL